MCICVFRAPYCKTNAPIMSWAGFHFFAHPEREDKRSETICLYLGKQQSLWHMRCCWYRYLKWEHRSERQWGTPSAKNFTSSVAPYEHTNTRTHIYILSLIQSSFVFLYIIVYSPWTISETGAFIPVTRRQQAASDTQMYFVRLRAYNVMRFTVVHFSIFIQSISLSFWNIAGSPTHEHMQHSFREKFKLNHYFNVCGNILIDTDVCYNYFGTAMNEFNRES